MKTKLMVTCFAGLTFIAGVAAERWGFHHEKRIELYLVLNRRSGYLTAYTFYRDPYGREVKHGDSHEFDLEGVSYNFRKFDDGKIVGLDDNHQSKDPIHSPFQPKPN